jgi:predicted nucleotidyltransferase
MSQVVAYAKKQKDSGCDDMLDAYMKEFRYLAWSELVVFGVERDCVGLRKIVFETMDSLLGMSYKFKYGEPNKRIPQDTKIATDLFIKYMERCNASKERDEIVLGSFQDILQDLSPETVRMQLHLVCYAWQKRHCNKMWIPSTVQHHIFSFLFSSTRSETWQGLFGTYLLGPDNHLKT